MANPLDSLQLNPANPPEPKRNRKMGLALLLQAFASFLGDDDEDLEEDGIKPPATKAFREPAVRTRPDWFPWSA